MNLKMIAAAVALVVAGSANAALTIDTANTGSSLFIEAWDTTSGQSFVQDLGKTFETALSMGSLSFNLDSASFATLLGTDTAGTNLSWHVFASLSGVDQPYSMTGILTTVSTVPGAPYRLDYSQNSTLQNSQATHIADINGVITTGSFGTMANSNPASGAANGSAYFGAFLGGDSAKKGFGAIDFYSYINDSNTFALNETKLTGTAGGDGQFKLASNGLLTFNAPVAAPSSVPLPAAAWLFGSGLLGLVGISRRRKQG